jgi:hypothetical protein
MEIFIMISKQNQIKGSSSMIRSSVVALGIIGSMLVVIPAMSAPACKGLNDSACANEASCGWVEGYQRKDGRSVKSFCRTKSISKKSTSKTAGKPSS